MDPSPYHLFRLSDQWDAEKSKAHSLYKKLPTQFNPSITPTTAKHSLDFKEICNALDLIGENRANKVAQSLILRNIFNQSMSIASGAPSRENVLLEIFLLLKILIPHHDIDNVYGMKTKRLIKLFSGILKNKFFDTGSSIVLNQWIANPDMDYSNLTQGMVSCPEIVIAQLVTALKNRSPETYRKKAVVTVQDIGILCSSLTSCYLEAGPNLDILQSEILFNAAKNLDFKELTLFLRILLKKVSIGVGPMTVLQCMPHIDATAFYEKQHDLGRLAELCVKHAADPKDIWRKQSVHLECGHPFNPMTCKVLKSPFLFKWIFSSEEKLKKPISPIDGRLVISSKKWYIPMKNNAKQKTFVNIDSDNAMRNQSRKKHIILLRQLQSQGAIDETECEGLVIHYTFSVENVRETIMLIRNISNALTQNIELFDDTVQNGLKRVDMMVMGSFSKRDSDPVKISDTYDEKSIETQIDKIIQKPQNTSLDKGDEEAPENNYRVQVRNALKMNAKRKQIQKKPALLASSKKGKKQSVESAAATSVVVIEKEEKVIVQVKYDGDRIQIHAKPRGGLQRDEERERLVLQVKLFTKSGRDVSDLYSNIRDELEQCEALVGFTPCILDGEILVVNEKNEPLPWSSEKWRYNEQASNTNSSLVQGSLVSVVYENEESTINNHSDEIYEDSITFGYAQDIQKAIKKMGIPAQTKPVSTPGCKLKVIVYDVLMDSGMEVTSKPCIDRLNILRRKYEPTFKSLKHCQVIQETSLINTTEELLKLLTETVVKQYEGLILKDPSSPYEFKKTNNVQKLKIGGPDINTYIAGAGFSFSSNPRQWGFLTCVRVPPREPERAMMPQFKGYVRTDILEGTEPWRALELYRSVSSSSGRMALVESSEVLGTNYKFKDMPTTAADAPEISWKAIDDDHVQIMFKAKKKRSFCELILSKSHFKDIQWISNPLECPFSLSVRGDLWPVPSSTPPQHALYYIPRNPVGRIELSGFQMSECDTVLSIQQKYEDSQRTTDYLESSLSRLIKHLRPTYPTQDKNLQLTRKILMGYIDYKQNKDKEPEKWPQPPPTLGFSLENFSSLLSTTAAVFKSATTAFHPLSMQEQLVLAQVPTKNEWSVLEESEQVKEQKIQDIQHAEEDAEMLANISQLCKRLNTISSHVQVPLVAYAKSTTPTRTSFILQDHVTLSKIDLKCSVIYPPPLIDEDTGEDTEEESEESTEEV